jgi:hypothetical protein
MISNINTFYYEYSNTATSLDMPISSVGKNSTTIQTQTQKSQSENSQSVKVTISDEALQKLGLAQEDKASNAKQTRAEGDELTPEEIKEVEELKARDKEVHDHERAHMMAGGELVRKGASYQYTTGPDGKRYAVGGEVSIDTSEVKDNPEATITKMQQVRRAALAPAEPSGQDRSVASTASQKEAQARQEVRQQSAT